MFHSPLTREHQNLLDREWSFLSQKITWNPTSYVSSIWSSQNEKKDTNNTQNVGKSSLEKEVAEGLFREEERNGKNFQEIKSILIEKYQIREDFIQISFNNRCQKCLTEAKLLRNETEDLKSVLLKKFVPEACFWALEQLSKDSMDTSEEALLCPVENNSGYCRYRNIFNNVSRCNEIYEHQKLSYGKFEKQILEIGSNNFATIEQFFTTRWMDQNEEPIVISIAEIRNDTLFRKYRIENRKLDFSPEPFFYSIYEDILPEVYENGLYIPADYEPSALCTTSSNKSVSICDRSCTSCRSKKLERRNHFQYGMGAHLTRSSSMASRYFVVSFFFICIDIL